jgi:hypothetical protein
MPNGSCSGRVRSVGWLAVIGNSFAALGLLMFDYQSGGHGEMGSFYHSNMIWFLGFEAWGFGTGIGLLRAWRWARISTLIFSGLLAAFGNLSGGVSAHASRQHLRRHGARSQNLADVALCDPDCDWAPLAGFLQPDGSEGLFRADQN